MVRASRERHDRQVGALAGRQGTHLILDSQRSGGVERRHAQRIRGQKRLRALRAGASHVDRGAHLLEHVEGRSRGGRVGSEADAHVCGTELGHRCGATAEQGIGARAVRDRDVPLSQQRDLLRVHLDAVRTQQVGAEHRLEGRHGALPGRWHEDRDPVQRAAAVLEPLVLVCTLGEVGADRDPEREAPAVRVERARIRRVRRDADPHEVGLLDERALLVELALGVRGIVREHLEVHGRPQPQLCGGGRRGPGEAVVGGGRDPGAQRLEDAEAGDRDHVVAFEPVLSLDVRGDPRAECLAVSEPGVRRVLEVRVRVDEARHDRRVCVMAIGVAPRHLDDCAALVADKPALDRRPVDG